MSCAVLLRRARIGPFVSCSRLWRASKYHVTRLDVNAEVQGMSSRATTRRCASFRARRSNGSALPPEVRPGEVDDLVATTAQHGLEREDPEPDHLLETDGRRHRELSSVHEHLDESGPVVS